MTQEEIAKEMEKLIEQMDQNIIKIREAIRRSEECMKMSL
jgi:uncharacterized ferredoxin-like protein